MSSNQDKAESVVGRRETEDDVEGHSMLPDPSMARHLANAREAEIRQHLKRHDYEADARRPHKR